MLPVVHYLDKIMRVITNLTARYSLSLNSKTYQSFCYSWPGEEKRARPAFETVVPLRQMWYAAQIKALSV